MKMRLLLFSLCFLVPAGGCSLFQEKSPREVRVVIEGHPGMPLTVITSTHFQPEATAEKGENGHRAIRLYSADTLLVAPPFNGSYDIRSTRRFFIRASRSNPHGDQLMLRIHIDGREMFEFNSATTSEQDSTLQYTFIYRD